MKSSIKIMAMLIIGLTIATLIYPFLHETGHSIATVLVGGDVIKFHLFPLPNILCNVATLSSTEKVLIGISGMLFPIVVSSLLFHSKKRFWLWYATLILRGICVLSIAMTIVATFLYTIGKPVINEDITTVLNIAPNLVKATAIASLLVISGLIIIIMKDNPVKKIGDYLLK